MRNQKFSNAKIEAEKGKPVRSDRDRLKSEFLDSLRVATTPNDFYKHKEKIIKNLEKVKEVD